MKTCEEIWRSGQPGMTLREYWVLVSMLASLNLLTLTVLSYRDVAASAIFIVDLLDVCCAELCLCFAV